MWTRRIGRTYLYRRWRQHASPCHINDEDNDDPNDNTSTTNNHDNLSSDHFPPNYDN